MAGGGFGSLSLVALALVKFLLPESHVQTPALRAAHAAGRTARPCCASGRACCSSPRAALLVTTAQGILESIFALWALNRFGAGPRTVAFALFGAALVAVVMQGGLVRVLAPRLGERRLAQAGVLCYVVGLLSVGTGGQQPDGRGAGAAVSAAPAWVPSVPVPRRSHRANHMAAIAAPSWAPTSPPPAWRG